MDSASLTVVPQTAHNTPVTVIKPSKGWGSIDIREIWDHRELLFFLAWRNVTVRYKQTVFGPAWIVLQPILTMVLFTLLFGRLARIDSDGLPYSIFMFAGLVPWNFFATVLQQSSSSLVSESSLIQSVYFPRLILPLSTVLSCFLDFILAFVILLGMMVFFHIYPTLNVLWLPAFVVLTMIISVGVGFVLSALNLHFRDVSQTIHLFIRMWFFATPVTYASRLLPGKWNVLYNLNPMVVVVDGFRWALLGTDTAPGLNAVVASVTALAVLFGGAYFFTRMGKTFADMV